MVGDARLMVVLLLPRLVPIYYMTILTDAFVRVIVSSIRTNRARCALYKKIYSMRKAFMEKAVVELVYKSRRVLQQMFETRVDH